MQYDKKSARENRVRIFPVRLKSVTGRKTGGRSKESAALAVSGISPAVNVHP